MSGQTDPDDMLSCQELTEVLTEYLEGEMSLWDGIRFELHLALCPGCRGYLQQMRATIGTLGRLPPERVPPEMEQKLLRLFRDWKRVP